MKLFRSEVLRARSRRLVKVLLLGTMGLMAVGFLIGGLTSPPKPTDSEVAALGVTFQRVIDRCMGDVIDAEALNGESQDVYCVKRASLSETDTAGIQLAELEPVMRGISHLVILLGIVLGATLAGADWTANTMTTLLTWEPRRGRVLLTRAVVVVLVVVGVAVVLQATFVLLFDLVANVRGITDFLWPGFWWDVGTTGVRVALVTAAFALMAFAIGMIGRSTVAALGALFGYLIVIEGVLPAFRPKLEQFLAVRAAVVVINRSPLETSSGAVIDTQQAVIVLGVYVLVLLLLATVLFRRRDVT